MIKERVKSILIIMLLIMGIIQVGILWGDQSHGLPTNILEAIFGRRGTAVNYEKTSHDLFMPYREVVSDGESNWIISSGGQFNDLWDDGKSCLKSILSGAYTKLESNEDWGTITSKKGITFSFKAVVSSDLLTWYLGLTGSAVEIPQVMKIKIIPAGNVKGSVEVYLYAGSGKPERFRVDSYTPKVDLQKLITGYTETDEANVRSYYTMKYSNQDTTLGMDPDVLYVASPPKYWTYQNLRVVVPERLADAKLHAEEISSMILGTEKSRYSVSTYPDNTLQIDDTSNNRYKIYTDGMLEYNYLQSTGTVSDKGKIGDALLNAYRFISTCGVLLDNGTNVRLVITGIDDTQGDFYTFKFGYFMDGKPVSVHLAASGSGERMNDSIEINASGSRVLKCRWLMRNFTFEGSGKYCDRYMDIMNSQPAAVNAVEKDDSAKVRDISVGYALDTVKGLLLKPAIIIEKSKVPGDSPVVQAMQLPEEKAE